MVVDSGAPATVQASTVRGFDGRVYSRPSGTSTATITTGIGYDTALLASTAGLTATTLAGFRMINPAANTITNLIGLDINDLTSGTNNYGIRSSVSSGANKYNIYADGTANSYFAGNVGIGTTAPASLLHGVASLAAATGNETAYTLAYTTNKATSGNDTGLLISMTDTASPGTSLPLNIQVGGVSKASIDNVGKLNLAASALPGTPATGDIAIDSGASNALKWYNGSTWKSAGGGGFNLVKKTADQTNSTITGVAVTDLSIPVVANGTYSFQCQAVYSADATGTGVHFAMNGPASPTQFSVKFEVAASATADTLLNTNAYLTYVLPAGSAGTTRTVGRITGVLRNGANAGNLQVYFKSESAGKPVVVYTGSWCQWIE